MKQIIIVFFTFLNILSFSQSDIRQNQEWEVSSSSIKFKIKNAGISVSGTFSELTAKINFDETKKTGNSIEATINSKTVNTDNNSRDEHLKKTEYFDIITYPKISMKATQFVKDKNGNWIGLFKLTIKGITKEIYVPFVFSNKDNNTTIKGTFTINRLDYTIGKSSMILADNVIITIELLTNKK